MRTHGTKILFIIKILHVLCVKYQSLKRLLRITSKQIYVGQIKMLCEKPCMFDLLIKNRNACAKRRIIINFIRQRSKIHNVNIWRVRFYELFNKQMRVA